MNRLFWNMSHMLKFHFKLSNCRLCQRAISSNCHILSTKYFCITLFYWWIVFAFQRITIFCWNVFLSNCHGLSKSLKTNKQAILYSNLSFKCCVIFRTNIIFLLLSTSEEEQQQGSISPTMYVQLFYECCMIVTHFQECLKNYTFF